MSRELSARETSPGTAELDGLRVGDVESAQTSARSMANMVPTRSRDLEREPRTTESTRTTG